MPRAQNPNEPTAIKQYRSVLRQLMSHKNSTNYCDNYEFSDAELGDVKPDDIYRWMCWKAYHKYDPGPQDRPRHARSSSLEFWKKSISYFMPQLWNEYEFGLGGRKPARQFTAVERGAVKFSYSRRKTAWDAIDRMVRSGATAQVAIDRIYGVYGRLNVSLL